MVKQYSVKAVDKPATEEDMKSTFLASMYRQSIILTTKNYILLTRNRKSFITQLIVPLLFVAFLKLLQIAIALSANRGPDRGDLTFIAPIPIAAIPRCIPPVGQSTCITLVYTPGNSSIVTDLVNKVAIGNSIPTNEVKPFNTQNEVDDYLVNNPQTVYSGVEFKLDATGLNIASYALQFNQSIVSTSGSFNFSKVLPLQRSIDEELMKTFSGGKDFKYKPSVAQFPHPALSSQGKWLYLFLYESMYHVFYY